MTHLGKLTLAAVLLAGVPALRTAASADEPATGPAPSVIARAVRDLGDDSYDRREAAEKTLAAQGDAAVPALKAAASDPDPERSYRAAKVLRALAVAVVGETPPEVVAALRRYRDGDVSARRIAVSTINDVGAGARYVARLFAAEPAGVERDLLFGKIDPRPAAAVLLSWNDNQDAEALLDVAVRNNGRGAYAADAMYWQARGMLPRRLGEWAKEKRPKGQPLGAAAEYMAARTVGDLPAMRAAAVQDPVVLREFQFYTGDFAGLSDSLAQGALGTNVSVWTSAFAVRVHELADRQDRAQASMAWLQQQTAAKPDATATTGKLLLLIGHPAEAVKLWEGAAKADGSRGDCAIELAQAYFSLAEYEKGFALADRVARTAGRQAFEAQVLEARTWGVLGGKAKATAAFGTAWSGAADDFDRSRVITNEVAAGLDDAAMSHAAYCIGRESDDQRMRAINALYQSVPEPVLPWYRALARNDRSAGPEVLLKRLHDVWGNSPDLSQVTALADDIQKQGDPEGDRPARWSVVRRFVTLDRSDLALPAAERLVALDGSAEAILLLGNHEAYRGRWESAARFYQRATELDPASAVAQYCRGYAAEKLGDHAAGESFKARSRILLLARVDQARAIYVFLSGVHDDLAVPAAEDYERAARPGAYEEIPAAQCVADALMRKKDFAGAAAAFQRMLLLTILNAAGLAEMDRYFDFPLAREQLLAKRALAAGDLPGCMTHARAAATRAVAQADFLIDLVNTLDRAGHKAEADELFNATWDRFVELAKTYPDSAFLANNGAWMAARCGRKLDWALDQARHAVSLAPQPQFMDTLAEVYFHQGDKTQAVDEEKKAIAIQDLAELRVQLHHFEHDSPKDPEPEEVGEPAD